MPMKIKNMATTEKYRKLKKEAHDLFVNDGLTAVEISTRLSVSKKTLSAWINDSDSAWKRERDARMNTSAKQGDNIREIIGILSEKKLALFKKISDAEINNNKELLLSLRKDAASIDDAVAKWNKTLQDMNKGANRITLSIFLECMDMIFDNLRIYDAEMYQQTLDFQEALVNEQTKILG